MLHTELQTLGDGTVRAQIIDPVWKGWVVLRTRRGDSNLENTEGDDSIGRRWGVPQDMVIFMRLYLEQVY